MQLRMIDRSQRILGVALLVGAFVACGDDDTGPSNGRDGGAAGTGTPRMDSSTPSTGLPDNTAGKACTDNRACGSGMCAMQVVSAGLLGMPLPAPGGYCTASCTTDAECGAGGACLDDMSDLDFADSQCYARCATPDDCREGYTCSVATTLMGMISTCRPKPDTDQLDDGVVGDECTDADDCPGGTCLTATPPIFAGVGSTPLPGGYCSGSCVDATSCGEGGVCVPPLAGLGAGAGTCYLGCSTDDDCERDGYRCRQDASGSRTCMPAADPLPDDTAGDACSDDSDCGDVAGSCVTQLPGMGVQGFMNPVAAPGGYCSAACVEPLDCGQGGACVLATCYATCTDVSDCRDGYICEMRGLMGIPGATPQMVCVPGTTEDPDAG